MLSSFKIIKLVMSFIIPYIILYSLYIQLNGEVSPGGGFQAGVIFATGIIAYDLLLGKEMLDIKLPIPALLICSSLGVSIYAVTGLVAMLLGGEFLNYNVLLSNPIAGQHLGIFIIELGVGLTVSSVMSLIYSLLREEG